MASAIDPAVASQSAPAVLAVITATSACFAAGRLGAGAYSVT